MWREKNSRREIRLISLLQFIQMTVWKTLFDKIADGLERSTEAEDECTAQVARLKVFRLS